MLVITPVTFNHCFSRISMVLKTHHPERIHVAAAAVFDGDRVLICRRPPHVHQGGLWEFPGGKLEAGETIESALRRELREEIGIDITSARPLIRVHHDYPDREVLLDVWRVEGFAGKAVGHEGQPIRWVSPQELGRYRFPAANKPIIKAVCLPDRYLITPEPGADVEKFLVHLDAAASRGVALIQLRAKQWPLPDYQVLVKQALEVCHARNARLLLNAEPSVALELGADGVHLTSARLLALRERPLDSRCVVGASCHNRQELEHACTMDLDFVVVSPVRETVSHPGAKALGFVGLQDLTEQADLPVYALGGMTDTDLVRAFGHGAQGIAAIRGLWLSH
jgi:8-oxo-dGTP diphosphatase